MIVQPQKKTFLFQILIALCFLMTSSLSALDWETPVEVSQGLGSTETPATIVVDLNDNAAIVWRQTGEIYSSYRPFAGSWESPTNHGKGRDPHICMDDSGNITIIFVTTSASDTINAVFRPYGGAWNTAETLASGTAGELGYLSLSCIDTSFFAYAAWFDNNGGSPKLSSVYRRLAGSGIGGSTGWDTTNVRDVNLGSQTADTDSRPLVGVLTDGTGVIIARLLNGSTPDLYESTTNSPGGTWNIVSGLGVQAAASSDPGSDYVFALRPNGNGIVATSTASDEIWGTTSVDPISGWITPANISQSAAVDKSPQVSVDDAGIVQAVWTSIDGTNDLIAYKKSTASTNVWSGTASSLNLSLTNNARTPIISSSANGFTVIGWLEDPNATLVTRSLSSGVFNSGGPYTVDTNIAEGTVLTGTIAASATARGFAAWIDDGALNGFVESTGTNLPDDPVIASGDLLKILSKKRLIYQKGLYP